MSLIRDQIQKNAKQQPPAIKPLPSLQPAQANELEPAVSLSAPAPTVEQTSAFPDAEVEPAAEKTVEQAADNFTVDLQPDPIAPELQQQAPDARVEVPQQPLFRDISQELGQGGHYSTEAVQTTLPTFYVSNPNTDDYFSGQGRQIQSTIARQQREAYAAAQEASAINSTPGQRPNVPAADRSWQDSASQMFNDVVFGSKQKQQETDVGATFDPLSGRFGRQGANVGGAVKWLFNLGGSLVVGAAGEVTKTTANVLQEMGVSKGAAESFARGGPLGLLPKSERNPLLPQNWIGFDFEAANKRGAGGLIGDALIGEPVGDINDPRGSSKYGRIYFDPGADNKPRTIGEAISKRPVQSALQIATYLFNPGDNPLDDMVAAGVKLAFRGFRRGATKVAPEAAANVTELNAGISKEAAARAGRQAAADFERSEAERLYTANLPPRPPVPNMLDEAKAQAFQRSSTDKYPSLIGTQKTPVPELPPTFPSELAGDPLKQAAVALNPPPPKPLLVPGRVNEQKRKVQALSGEVTRLLAAEAESAAPMATEAAVEASRLLTMFAEDPVPAIAQAERLLSLLDDGIEPVVRELPPLISPDAVPRLDAARVFPERSPTSIPLHTAVVGIGRASTAPLLYSGDIVIRSFQDVADELFASSPELMKDFVGKGFGDLQDYIVDKGYDALDFTAVSYKRIDEPRFQQLTDEEMQMLSDRPLSPEALVDEVAAVVYKGNTLAVKKHPLATGKLTTLPLSELKAKAQDLVAADGANAIGSRLRDTDEYLSSAKEVYASEVLQKADGTYVVTDGRHRIALYEKAGVTDVPVILRVEKPAGTSRAAKEVPTADLVAAAQELASVKQVIAKPKQQLQQLFDETTDFGRRELTTPVAEVTTVDEVLEAFENGGKPLIAEVAYKAIDTNIANRLMAGAFDDASNLASASGQDITNVVGRAVAAHNAYASTGYTLVAKPATQWLATKLPADLYHGTPFANGFRADYNLKLHGSRGELGKGLYLTGDWMQSRMYAQASVSKNASPVTADFKLEPAIVFFNSDLKAPLDSRKLIPANDSFFDSLLEGLPETLQKLTKDSLRKTAKTQSYSRTLDKIEALAKKAGVSTSEESMQAIYSTLTDNLSKMGYDSVYDSSSKALMVIDNTRIAEKTRAVIAKPEFTPEQARYNVDAYMSSFYRKRLSTDANLRDSAYGVHDAVEQAVDAKLSDVQAEVIKRDIAAAKADDGVLSSQKPATNKPETVEQMFDELPKEDVCGV